MATDATINRSTHSPGTPPKVPSPEESAFALLSAAIKQGKVALEAKLEAWKLGLFQILLLIAMGIPMMFAGFLLLIHGFLLLDSALDYALHQVNDAPWFSPVLRGGVYFGIPCLAMLIILINVLPRTKKAKH